MTEDAGDPAHAVPPTRPSGDGPTGRL